VGQTVDLVAVVSNSSSNAGYPITDPRGIQLRVRRLEDVEVHTDEIIITYGTGTVNARVNAPLITTAQDGDILTLWVAVYENQTLVYVRPITRPYAQRTELIITDVPIGNGQTVKAFVWNQNFAPLTSVYGNSQ
jgi:hypothetical protein